MAKKEYEMETVNDSYVITSVHRFLRNKRTCISDLGCFCQPHLKVFQPYAKQFIYSIGMMQQNIPWMNECVSPSFQ